MEKSEFIRKLKGELRWKLSRGELKSVIREYSEYYDSASSELGSPALVATEILSERNGGLTGAKNARQRLTAALVVLAASFTIFIALPYWGNFAFINPVASTLPSVIGTLYLLIVLPAVLCLLVCRGVDRPGKGTFWLYGFGIAAAAAFFAVLYFASQVIGMLAFSSGGGASSFWSFDPSAVGPAVSAAIFIISLVTLAVIAFSLLLLLRGRHLAMPVIFFASALLCGFSEQLTLLFMLDSPASYFYSNEVIWQHILLGFAIAIGLFIYLQIKARRSEQ